MCFRITIHRFVGQSRLHVLDLFRTLRWMITKTRESMDTQAQASMSTIFWNPTLVYLQEYEAWTILIIISPVDSKRPNRGQASGSHRKAHSIPASLLIKLINHDLYPLLLIHASIRFRGSSSAFWSTSSLMISSDQPQIGTQLMLSWTYSCKWPDTNASPWICLWEALGLLFFHWVMDY